MSRKALSLMLWPNVFVQLHSTKDVYSCQFKQPILLVPKYKLKCNSIHTYGFKNPARACNGGIFSIQYYCSSMFRLHILNK